MKINDEHKRVAEQLVKDEWLPARRNGSDKTCEEMVREGWLKKGERPVEIRTGGIREYGEVRTHYALTQKGITELVKPTYRLTWRDDWSFVTKRRSWYSHQGLYKIEQVGESFQASCNHYGRNFQEILPSLRAAKAACRKHDWSFVARRPLRKVSKHVWTAASGRIVVKYLTAPELRMAMPIGHTTTAPGYAIYVDGRYRDCGFNLHDVQQHIGFTGRKSGARIDLPEDRTAA